MAPVAGREITAAATVRGAVRRRHVAGRALGVVRDEAAQFSTDKDWAPQLDGPAEVPGIESLGDSAIVIRCLIKTQPGSQWNAAREFRRRLKIRFDREQIESPFPQRKVHVHVDDATSDRRLRAAGAAGG